MGTDRSGIKRRGKVIINTFFTIGFISHAKFGQRDNFCAKLKCITLCLLCTVRVSVCIHLGVFDYPLQPLREPDTFSL